MRKFSSGLAPIWAVVILGLALVIGYLVIKPTIPYSEPTPPTPSEESTENWKTFSSQETPTEFKIPPDWEVKEERIIGAYDNLIITASSPDFIQNNSLPSRGFQITFNLLHLDLSGSEKPVKFDSYESFRELGGFVTEERFKNIYGDEKIVTINGITWLKYPASAYTLYGKDTLQARIISTEEQQGVAETLFDQILSTFKFTDSEESLRCGGFAYRPCPEGYECKIEYTGKTDAERICVKN